MDGKTTFKKNSWFGAYQLYTDKKYYSRTQLQFNSVKVQDALIQIGQSIKYSFYDIVGKIDMTGHMHPGEDELERTKLLELEVVIADTIVMHSRKSFGLFDLMGAVGGFERNLTLIGMFFFKPIATHCYFLKAIQMLFMAKTDDDDLFSKRKNKKIIKKVETSLKMSQMYPPHKRDEILKDRHIKFSS